MKTSTEQTAVPLNTIKPLGNRIIIEPPELDTKDNEPGMLGLLHIPDGAKLGNLDKWREVIGLTHQTTALAVGEDCKVVKPGDRIVVTDAAVFYVNVGDIRFCACTEPGVIAVVG